jgi:hypothetical protein
LDDRRQAERMKLRELFDPAGYVKKVVEALVIGVPLGLVTAFEDHVKDQFIATPWKILWFALPLVALNTFAWIKLRPRGLRDLDWRALLFCSLYCAMFSLFCTGELFAWKRVPRVSTDVAHENYAALLPIRWGDWRYWFIRQPRATDIAPIAVLLASHQNETLNQLRLHDLRSLDIADQGNAAGLALDISYTGTSGVDNLFCREIARIVAKQRVLVTAYELREVTAYGYERIPKVNQQPQCLNEDHQGHSFGLADMDGLVRGIPLFWESPEKRHPALSWQFVADRAEQRHEKRKPERPADLFLRLLPPPDGAVRIFRSMDDFKMLADHPGVLSGDIVVMGDLSAQDRFRTPFGTYSGAVIHAFAIYDLESGYFMTRAPYFLSLALIFVPCLILTLAAHSRSPVAALLRWAGGMTLLVLLLSASVMYFLQVWLDVIYATCAMWLLVPLLLGLSRWRPGRRGLPELALVQDTPVRHVLSGDAGASGTGNVATHQYV